MHRNTAVFIAFLAIVAGLLAWVRFRNAAPASLAVPTPTVMPTSTPTPAQKTYNSDVCSVTLSYPENLRRVESTDSGTAFIDEKRPERSVVLGCTESIPPFDADSSTRTVVRYASGSATVSAILYHIDATGSANATDTLLFRNPENGLRVFLTGFGDTFRQILSTVKIW